MSNCQVSHSKESGVEVQVGLITMNGSGTSIHNNVTGGSSKFYGLEINSTPSSSSSIHLVSPLTKESVSINNGDGGNYGGDGFIGIVDNEGHDHRDLWYLYYHDYHFLDVKKKTH